MQSRSHSFTFSPNYNFGVDNLFIVQHDDSSGSSPPIVGDFLLLDGTSMLLLDGTDFLLL